MRRYYSYHLLWPLLVAFCLLQASCAHRQRIKSQSGPLAESLEFVEQDHLGKDHFFARVDEERPGKVRIPAPGMVDIDSLVEINIDKSMLTTGQPPRLDQDLAKEMQAEHTWLKDIIERLDKAAEARKSYVEAYANLIRIRKDANVEPGKTADHVRKDPNSHLAVAHKAWTRTQNKLDDLEGDIFVALDEKYGETDPEFAEVLGSKGGENLQGLREVLEARFQKSFTTTNKEQERWLDPLKEVNTSLELEFDAFLVSGKKRAQVHLPGYDQLGEGQVQRRHVSALDLSNEDRKELESQWQSTIELSKALESYRQGTSNLNNVIEKTKAIVAPEVTALIDKAVALRNQWMDLDPKDFVDGTIDDLELLANKAGDAAAKVSAEAITILKSLPEKIQPQLESAKAIEAYVEKLAGMKDRTRSIKPENLPAFLFDTKDLLDEGSELLKIKLTLTMNKDQDVLKALIKEELAPLYQKAEEIDVAADRVAAIKKLDAVNTLLSQPEAQRLEARLKTVYDLYTGVAGLVADANELLLLIGIRELPQEVGTINSYRVPLDKVTDTSIDLLKTPRQTGDRLEFRARLYSAGITGADPIKPEPIDELEASFEIRQFGWHNRLSPSVVLVRPTELAAREESFAFAPALSWVHRYGVRPEQDSFLANLQRFFDASFGMHASFVNFDPDKEVEIGLGSTLSFWKDRLQFGAGVNLMAESKDDGRYYFFVGSDLISLLNTIGIGM